jgi:ubiquinone/menaquinone biosynthesis C-methylase UbiE
MQLMPDPDEADYKRRWLAAYETNCYGSGLSGRVLTRTHALIERELGRDRHFAEVLEVGAGTGIHLDFVRHSFARYVMSDASLDTLREATARRQLRDGVELAAIDATRLPHADASFDRLIATHVLEHLPEPHRVLREWARVLKPGGVLSLILPCDPGLAWRLGRHFGPRRSALAAGIDYDYWMAREHINPINNLLAYIRHYFPDRRERFWPLPWLPSSDVNLIYAVNIVV